MQSMQDPNRKKSNESHIKICHTAPTSILPDVSQFTDFDHAFVDLFDSNKEYYNYYKNAISNGRIVILNCSTFRSKESYDFEKYAEYIRDLKPYGYVVPDVNDDCEQTLANLRSWKKKYYDEFDGKCNSIGVVQAKTYKQFLKCYHYMAKWTDRVAFAWDCLVYENFYMRGDWTRSANYTGVLAYGRQTLLQKLFDEGNIDVAVPHDLLGCALPHDVRYYKHYDWIHSITTSHPVISGMAGWNYTKIGSADQTFGIEKKSNTTIAEIVDDEVLSSYNYKKIMNNIRWFHLTLNS